MEEKSKVIDMSQVKTAKPVEEKQQLTYEQLNNLARQLSEQNNQLRQKLGEINMVNVFKRLDYCFKVLEHSNYFVQEFVTGISNEIQAVMTVPEDDAKKEGEPKDENK